MIGGTHLFAFALTAFVVIAVPGPSVLFVVARALTLGRRSGLATVLGNALGVYVQMIAIAFGLGSIVATSVAVFDVIKYVGAAYLVFLGVQAIRHRRRLSEALALKVEPKSVARAITDAFVVGIANPKSLIFFAAILPQYVDPHDGPVPVQMLLLGAVFFGIALVSDGGWAMAAGTARRWLTRTPRRLEAVGGAGGLAMIGIGLNLAVNGRQD